MAVQKIIRSDSRVNLETDDIYDIGSEHCCVLCIQNLESFNINLPVKKDRLRVVTPRTPQKYIGRMMHCVCKFIERYNINSLVVNDLGILHEVRKTGINTGIILGRLLVKCQDYELGYERRLERTGDDTIVKCWLTPSIHHAKKTELFRRYNVKGVELCPTRAIKEYIESADTETDIYIHRNTVVGALGRACIMCRQSRSPAAPDCGKCARAERLEHKDFYDRNYIQQSERGLFPKNRMVGNIVYFLVDTEGFPFDKCKAVIYDKKIDDSL